MTRVISLHDESLLLVLFVSISGATRAIHSFPTRRSSDLIQVRAGIDVALEAEQSRVARAGGFRVDQGPHGGADTVGAGDRKSTRLNSSHPSISYAVFCLKKNSG